jgi:predicted nucleic acid-binding protein
MTVVLDAGGVSELAGQRHRLEMMLRGHKWPPQVPAVVLAETLTGDHRWDFEVNRLLRSCQVREVTELHARSAARMRTRSGRAGKISATDAIVAAVAETCPDPVVMTSDPRDLAALVAHAARPVKVESV